MSLSNMQDDGPSIYQLIESNPSITILLLYNKAYFDEAVKILQSKVATSPELTLNKRQIGVMVVPKDFLGIDNTRIRELSNSRIVIRISEEEDLEAAAQKFEQEIMRQYQLAKNNFDFFVNA